MAVLSHWHNITLSSPMLMILALYSLCSERCVSNDYALSTMTSIMNDLSGHSGLQRHG